MSPGNKNFWLAANWPAPDWVKAGTTTRQSGHSLSPYDGLNLATHVEDDLDTVRRNRALLERELQLPSSPLWLQQVHGMRIINSDDWTDDVSADACYTLRRKVVCAVLSADCLPLLLCDKEGSQVAAVHIGWRGYCGNIIDQALANFKSEARDILAWIGPHIHAANYEVGEDVHSACLTAKVGTDHAFTFLHKGKWQASLELLVRHQLEKLGISKIYDSNLCSFDEKGRFYSYRREAITGRMASLIWMESDNN